MILYTNKCKRTIKEFLDYYKLSKTNIYKLVMMGLVKVNGEIVKSKDVIINENDKVEIDDYKLKGGKYIPWNINIDVLYEDEDILIVYKPRGMLVHPDSNTNNTLVNAVSYYFRGKNIVFEHLHRLDKETFGMVVFSKNILAHAYLSYLWENHQVKKYYIALCYGHFKENKGEINLKIGSDRHSNKQIISKNGSDAKTMYSVVSEKNGISKLKVEIIGGRRHQIRLHLSSIKHPILGDKLYGINDCYDKMMLEFYKIEFIHPRTQELFTFEIKQEF